MYTKGEITNSITHPSSTIRFPARRYKERGMIVSKREKEGTKGQRGEKSDLGLIVCLNFEVLPTS